MLPFLYLAKTWLRQPSNISSLLFFFCVTVSPEYLLSVGIRDVDTMRTVIEKSKDRAVFADIKFYQKKIDDITGKIDGGGIYKTFGTKEKADQGIRRNANRIYNQYIADGFNAETAFMKTVNGYMLQQDKLPTIYDINQVIRKDLYFAHAF